MSNDCNPNLFLAGAPKCGTTSLASWLSQHPDVFLPQEKEPSHFYHPNQDPMDFDAYLALYSKAAATKYRLDGSIWYMFSPKAIQKIDQLYPESRFIICLRNPVDMFFSLHQQKIFSGQERLKNPVEAWKAGDRRAEGEPVGIWAYRGLDMAHMAYNRSCALGTQVEFLLGIISRERIYFVLFDDLSARPSDVYKDLCEWLALNPVDGVDFAAKNPAKVARSELLNIAMLSLSKLKRRLVGGTGSGLLSKLHQFNSTERRRVTESDEFVRELNDYFSPEVDLLEKLLNRDLWAWKQHPLR